jgi:AraC-like DNA-binding protein
VQIHEFSGEKLEHVARDHLVPLIARARPDSRGLAAVQELDENITLCLTHLEGPIRMYQANRTTRALSRDNLMIFGVHVAGGSRLRQHDRSVALPAGTGVLCEARSPWEMVSPIESRSLTLRFPRELLPLRTAEITEGCAHSMAPSAPGMQMLSGYLGQLFETAHRLTPLQRLDAGRAAIDLLAMALRDVSPSVPGGDGSSAVLLDVMRTHVREHLADPALDVEELARRHHVSVRHAYTLFERIGTTPGAYLREQRLLAAREMLSDPRYDRLTVLSIAAAVGLLDLGTFGRAFRREYGMSPGAWRREHRHS